MTEGSEAGRRAGARLIDIVSGSFGAGHDAAAREIAQRFRARGYVVRVWDIVDLMPGGLGRALRATYLRQIRSVPASWGWLLRSAEHSDSCVRWVERAMNAAGGALLDIAAARPTAIVSTHPFASQALGELRTRERLDVRVVTYLTDMSVHRLWVHPGVDVHLAVHELPAQEASKWGAGLTRVIRPAVPAWFSRLQLSARSCEASRAALGLPQHETLVLVTGGSRGVGDLVRASGEIAGTGLAVPVVLCGTNDRHRRRVERGGEALALGWVDDMPAAMAAVDAVVQNAGGFTSLEALASGVPVLSYRTIPGHGESNADALDRSGLAPRVRSPEGLAPALERVLAERVEDPWTVVKAHPDVVDASFEDGLEAVT